ncbi:sulfite exporter TauE/SafE-domain-containing protein [Ochromonadaceae sp. CCMP2298]|nr:sulfite exporter TauE/SafE-domain-containing protein [Ochromonadaceae sp. CCMP2298]
MLFGSMLAGATSEGGAAIAFPVLTLTLGVAPAIARDFSYLIQSVGMTAAAFSILFMHVRIERRAIFYCTIGGVVGVVFGLEKVAPTLEPAYSKMYFVCIWASFAFALFWFNYFRQSRVFVKIPLWETGEIIRVPILSRSCLTFPWGANDDPEARATVDLVVNTWAIVLLVFGFLGGIFSSISGSGLDICAFAVLTLYFRVSERVATPTSVVLMAINTVAAFLYRRFAMQDVDPEVYNLWLVCIPVVVIGAPLGAILSSHFHRNVLLGAVYITDTAQLVGALVVLEPWTTKSTNTPVDLCVDSAIILVSGALFFTVLAFAGRQMDQYIAVGNRFEDKSEKWSEKGTWAETAPLSPATPQTPPSTDPNQESPAQESLVQRSPAKRGWQIDGSTTSDGSSEEAKPTLAKESPSSSGGYFYQWWQQSLAEGKEDSEQDEEAQTTDAPRSTGSRGNPCSLKDLKARAGKYNSHLAGPVFVRDCGDISPHSDDGYDIGTIFIGTTSSPLPKDNPMSSNSKPCV